MSLEEGNLVIDSGEYHVKTWRHRKRMSYKDRRTWRWPCDDGSRDQNAATVLQGMPRIADRHQKQEEARKNYPLQVSEGAWPCWHLDLHF